MKNRKLRISVIIIIAISVCVFVFGCTKPPKMIDNAQNEEWKIDTNLFQITQIERIILPDSVKGFRYKNLKTRVVYIKDHKNPKPGFNTYSREVQTFKTVGLDDKTIKGIHFIDLSKAHQIPNREFVCKNKNKLHVVCSFDKENEVFVFTKKTLASGDEDWTRGFIWDEFFFDCGTVLLCFLLWKFLEGD